MSLKTFGRSLEKKTLRPLFRRLKRLVRTSVAHERIQRLEERVEQLESLLREQAGLHYLRLAGEAEDEDDEESAHGRRTA